MWSHSWMEVPIGVTLEVDEVDRGRLLTLLPDGVPEDITGGAWAKARLAIDDNVRGPVRSSPRSSSWAATGARRSTSSPGAGG